MAFPPGSCKQGMSNLRKIFFCCLVQAFSLFAHAQLPEDPNISIIGLPPVVKDSSLRFCIREIIVNGAHQTKKYIVLRELQFKTGDSLDAPLLFHELVRARQQVNNTTLFSEVHLEARAVDGSGIVITVTLKEKWFIYPVPQFQLVDRNFNVWAKTYDYSLSRVNYGLKFVHYNLTGRKDPLKIYLLTGYSRNILFSYSIPYINSALNKGFILGGGVQQNREIAYKTSPGNTVLFYPVDSATQARSEFVRNVYFLNGGYIIRKGLFIRHYFTAAYTYLKVADSVVSAKYNPDYFKDPVNAKGFFDLAYTYQYTNVDNVLYPLKGNSAYISVLKRGWGFAGGMDMLSLEGGWNKYLDLGRKWYGSFQFTGKVRLPFDQSYLNQRMLGYGEFYLRGQEYYVVDGVAAALLRSTFKKRICSFYIPFPFLHNVITRIPFSIFAKTYGDLGYAYNTPAYKANLNNRLLYTGGFGLDILTLYDVNLRLEYSFNQLNQKGLFFHAQSGF
jgi:outer membrane protein assembly factor BamA